MTAADALKDQTYFLALSHGGAFDRALFPVGHLLKPQVGFLCCFAVALLLCLRGVLLLLFVLCAVALFLERQQTRAANSSLPPIFFVIQNSFSNARLVVLPGARSGNRALAAHGHQTRQPGSFLSALPFRLPMRESVMRAVL